MLSKVSIVKVPYFNIWIEIPSAAHLRFITTDDDGTIRGWVDKPIRDTRNKMWVAVELEHSTDQWLGTAQFDGDYSDSLVELSEYYQELIN